MFSVTSLKKRDKKLPMNQKCGILLLLLIFAAVAAFLGWNALGKAGSLGVPEMFAYVPRGIAFIVVPVTVCILTGIWTSSSGNIVIARPM
ncbi:MAG: hypothetical protein KGY80_14545 [Candidatus Thorarchaeota archaeon]|nr:hypothetical protein [Candidatus Thorarchaeota archaeon]